MCRFCFFEIYYLIMEIDVFIDRLAEVVIQVNVVVICFLNIYNILKIQFVIEYNVFVSYKFRDYLVEEFFLNFV